MRKLLPLRRFLTLALILLLALWSLIWAAAAPGEGGTESSIVPVPPSLPSSSRGSRPAPLLTAYPPEVVAAPLTRPEDYDPGYDYDCPVPEREAVDLAWFSDAAFLGDSLTDGLLLYTGLTDAGADDLAYQAMNVLTITYARVIDRGGEKVTPLQALQGKPYGKIYISLGINEMNWYDDQRYYEHYAGIIDTLRTLQPQADIYLQTLLPVTAAKSADASHVTNAGVERLNGLIATLASEKQVYLVDPYSVFVGEDGALPAGWSTDGLHLTRARYSTWLDYLRSHTVQ